ncbi:MAG: PASTA domain-containing protein [Candidatus Eremiobacteraeota bacterium]|nr:PASTA domain-containing protein [Candidatus Eremiobacteraeota bacterium]
MSDDPQRPRRRRPRPGAPARRSTRTWTAYLPLVALAAFVIAVAFVAIVAWLWFAPAGKPVTVPPFIGMPFQKANALASSTHVGLRVVAHRTDFHAPKDVIIGQLPAAGEKVREGRVIDVILSDGVPTVAVPNLGNLSLRDAKLALENAHLTLGKVAEMENLDVIAGQILEQHPDPFTHVHAGSTVDVTVAKGRPQMYAPNFIGMSVDFVKQAARDAHIVLGLLKELPIHAGAKPKGTVVAQDPTPGALLGPKQKMALQISGGAPATPTPSPSPSAGAEASPTATSPSPSPPQILPSPGTPRTMRISVVLPKSDVARPVRVVLLDASGSKTIFEQTTTGGITLTFDLTVVGGGTIETYVDGQLVTSTPL